MGGEVQLDERSPIRAVLIVVPARDEEDRIGRCLDSLLTAAELARERCSVEPWIVVAADGCTDRTVHEATAVLAGAGDVIVGDWQEVGSARRAGVDAGLEHLGLDLADVWIANTDADCQVPDDWLVTQVVHAQRGADAVLGIVSVEHFDEHPLGTEDEFRRLYVLHADGSHDHVHGANLGIRADRYTAAGGWPRVALAEDHAMIRAAESAGASILRTIDVVVTTSGRRQGRAAGGFADMLVDLGASA